MYLSLVFTSFLKMQNICDIIIKEYALFINITPLQHKQLRIKGIIKNEQL